MLNFSLLDVLKLLWGSRPGIFKKEFWVGDFPDKYHPECFRCNLGNESCSSCEYLVWDKKGGVK